jgi:hypothetical protein
MSIQYINTGTAPNSGNGDVLRTAFNKVNANFKEITTYIVQSSTPPATTGTTVLWYDTVGGRMYTYLGGSWVDTSPIFLYPYGNTGTAGVVKVDGTTLVTVGNTGTIAVNVNAFPSNIIPARDSTYDLGSTSTQWRSIYVSTGSIYVGKSVINAESADGPLHIASPQGVMIDNTATFNDDLIVTGNIRFLGSSTQGNSGIFFGDQYGINALYAGVQAGYTPLPATVFQASANIGGYIQNNFQNINAGPQASTEWVATADNGTDSINYVDLGIAGSTWDGSQANSLGTAAQPNDAWLYTLGNPTNGTGGNLLVGTAQNGKSVLIIAGSAGPTSVVATFNSSGLSLNNNSILEFADTTVQTTAWTGNVITSWQATPTTATYVVAATDSVILVDNNGQTANVTLPTNSPQGKQFTIKKINGAGQNLNVSITGGALIDGINSTVTIATATGYLTVIADSNSAYWIINELL